MFEEESNNYADKYVAEGVDELKRKVIKGHWQDGAEFGYNKANEWHKVSDKLPPIGESVLLYYGVDIMGKAIVSTGCVDCKGNWYKNVDKEPVMWKEAVLPKESE